MKSVKIKKEPLMRLFAYLPPYKFYIFLALIAMVAAAAGSSLMALLMGKLTDLGFYQKNGLVAIWAPIALIGISVLHGGGQFCSSYLLQKVSQEILVKLRSLMFDHMIRWPEEVVQSQESGRVVSRFVNEASQALSGASQVLTVLVRDSLQVAALLCVLFWHNWQLTLVTFIVAPILIYILRTVSKRLKKLTSDSQVTFGQILSQLNETYRSERLIKVYNAYKFEEERFGHINRRLKGLTMRQQIVKGLGTPATQLISICGVAIVVCVALLQAQRGQLSLAEFVTYISAMLLMMPAIRKLAGLNGTIASMGAAAESLFEMIDIPLEKDPGSKDIERVKGNVEFKNVWYKYPNTLEPSLKDFSLKAEAGKMIAFVGASGAGKSTIINMIPRFMVPTKGEIFFDGTSQNEMTLESIRRQVAIVTQEVMLFDDTIAANIAFGAGRPVTDEEIMQAAEAAYLKPLIDSLPEGLQTRIGEGGSKLSGGQRQRVSIARALLKNAPILLLDEATSALDTESEKYIQASLDKLREGRTSFVVAHRLSTIVDADMIVVMDQGAVVEAGTHFELLENDGPYARLYKIQFSHQKAGKPETQEV